MSVAMSVATDGSEIWGQGDSRGLESILSTFFSWPQGLPKSAPVAAMLLELDRRSIEATVKERMIKY